MSKILLFLIFHHRVVSDQDCFFSLFEFFSCFKFTLHSCAMTVYRRNSEGALMSFAGHLTANRFLSCAEYLHHFLLSFFLLVHYSLYYALENKELHLFTG